LRFAAGETNAVSKVSQVRRVSLADRGGLLEKREASALQLGTAIGMLGEQPCRVCPILANHGANGPARAADDLFQPSSVIVIHGHGGFKGLFAARRRPPGSLIELGPPQQFFAQIWARDHAYPNCAARSAAWFHNAPFPVQPAGGSSAGGALTG
jgi:hypothetical protein